MNTPISALVGVYSMVTPIDLVMSDQSLSWAVVTP